MNVEQLVISLLSMRTSRGGVYLSELGRGRCWSGATESEGQARNEVIESDIRVAGIKVLCN